MDELVAENLPLSLLEERAPAEAGIRDHYGDVLRAVGKEKEAREAWQKALEVDPKAEGPRSKLRGD